MGFSFTMSVWGVFAHSKKLQKLQTPQTPQTPVNKSIIKIDFIFLINTMRSLKQDLLFLIAIRDCHKLKLFLNPNKFRRKFLNVLTIHKKDENGEHWYIRSNVLSRELCNASGDKKWHIYGRYHREDGPAYIDSENKAWWINGKLHRKDGPAIFRTSGVHEWFINDKRHRDDGPAYIWPDGSQQWYKNGSVHRDDGPARIGSDGSQQWWINGELHREDGPAYIGSDGSQEWYLNGKPVDPFKN